ncbi:MAG: MFS transporter [Burkholderiaceae bacterium]
MNVEKAMARDNTVWGLVLAAAAIMMITTGIRQTTGLFVSPLNTATGLGIVAISFALAIAQFVWGAAQPIFAAVGDKYGTLKVLIAGGLMLAAGTALTPFAHGEGMLIATLGGLSAAGAAAGSFALLVGVVSQRIAAERRSLAAGIVNAGGSFGQFVFAPLVQWLIGASGWVTAMFALAGIALLTVPLAFMLRPPAPSAPRAAGSDAASAPPPGTSSPGTSSASTSSASTSSPGTSSAGAVDGMTLGRQIRIALANRDYLLLHAGFFTCGFHIAFLVTHLPGEVQLCGLPASVASMSLALIGLFNIAGSLIIGWLGQHYRMKWLLALMYGSRAVAIVVYLLAPKTAATFYAFAAVLGFTWLATVPPTAGLIGKLFGARYLSTLFGLTLLSHQTGGFLGAWLGGRVLASDGNFAWMWYADIVLATAAALLNLPIRESRLPARAAAAAA